MKRAKVAAALVLWLALAQAATAAGEKYDPYKVPREHVRASVHTIALEPVRLPPSIENGAALRARIESLLTAKLRSGGFTVVPAAEYEQVWRQMSRRLGGVFDALTGVADQAKYDLAREHTARELADRLEIDALLVTMVSVSALPAGIRSSMFEAKYYAAGQMLVFRGEPIRGAPVNLPQKVLGTYLNVRLDNLDGVDLYSVRAPIEWVEIYAGRDHDGRPPSEWLTDPSRVSETVDLTLDDLVAPGSR